MKETDDLLRWPIMLHMFGGSKMKFKKFIQAAIVLVLTVFLTSCSNVNPAASKATVDALYT